MVIGAPPLMLLPAGQDRDAHAVSISPVFWLTTGTDRYMGLHLENLDAITRDFMLREFEADEVSGRLNPSNYFAEEGITRFPTLLRDAIVSGDDESLASALSAPGFFRSHYQRKTPSGGTAMSAVPRTASVTFSEGEFNRFYIRALCLRAIEGGGTVEVYRARASSSARQESEALIGQTLSAADLLEDLRTHIGEAPMLLPCVNSGLSVRLLY